MSLTEGHVLCWHELTIISSLALQGKGVAIVCEVEADKIWQRQFAFCCPTAAL